MSDSFKINSQSCFIGYTGRNHNDSSYRKISDSDINPILKLSDHTEKIVHNSNLQSKSMQQNLLKNPVNIEESDCKIKKSDKQDSYEDPDLPSEISQRERMLE